MSQASLEHGYVTEAAKGDPETGTLLRLGCPHVLTCRLHRNRWPQTVPTPPPEYKATKGQGDFIDSSGPIFTMYMEMASEEDKKMAEGWKADADGILIFVRH